MLRKSRQVYRQLGHDGKSLHANLSNRNHVRTPGASIVIIKKRKMNVYNCKYNCCYECKYNCCCDCYLRLRLRLASAV